jgi:ATP-binding protein involved in chromosome partitioning
MGENKRRGGTGTAGVRDRRETQPGTLGRHVDHEAEVRRDRDELEVRMSLIRHKIVVLSGKGGVGKSTVAVNLASALAADGRRIGLLDVDLHGPSVPGLLGLDYRPLTGRAGGIAPAAVAENLSAMSIQFFLPDADDAVIWRGPRKYSAIRELLARVDWGYLDCLVVDVPPGTGDEALAVVEMLGENTGAIVVSTPQHVALDDVRKAVDFCGKLGLPVHGVIENMSGFVCPHCGETTDIFLRGGAEAMAAEEGVPFLGRLPLDPAVVQAAEEGQPFVGASPGSPTAIAFRAAIDPLLRLTRPAAAPLDGAATDTGAESRVSPGTRGADAEGGRP